MLVEQKVRQLAEALRAAADSPRNQLALAASEGIRRAQLLKAAGHLELAAGELAVLSTVPTFDKAYGAAADMLEGRGGPGDR